MDGIERIWAPAFPDGEYSPEKAAARYVQYASDGTEVGFPHYHFPILQLQVELLQASSHMISPFYLFIYINTSELATYHSQGIVQAFTDILTHGAPAARIVMLHIASMNPDSPSACYINCTTGNNRSGVFIGVILCLLGVKPEKIAEEYSLSDIGLRPTRDAAVERLMKSPVFAGAGGGGRARAERMVGARPESMLAMLEMVNKKWGGAEGYFKTMAGLTDEDIQMVRRVLTIQEGGRGGRSHKRQGSVWDSTKAIATKLWGSLG
jgi:hypothetical protein